MDGTVESPNTSSPRSLADLALAGFSLVRQPMMRVAYEVHHVADRPGYLHAVVANGRSGARFIETLTTAAFGTGLVVGTRTLSAGADVPAQLGTQNPVQVDNEPQVARRFSGSAVPNVSFVYDPTHVFEGLIAVGNRSTQLQRRHGRAILDVISKIADLAAGIAEAPIMSLQSPVQLPPRGYGETTDQEAGPDERLQVKPTNWPRSAAIAVRFTIALAKPTAGLRLKLLETASMFCAERGFAFWAGDTRSAYRAGNWFSICKHDEKRFDQYFERSAEDGDETAPRWSLPVTFVGPARVGVIRSIVRYLRCFPPVGVLACSMSIIDDVAFIHLQLTSDAIAPGDLVRLNERLNRLTVDESQARLKATEPTTLLPRMLDELLVENHDSPSNDIEADLAKRVGDFHLLIGPAQPVPPVEDELRRALWVSWEVEGREAELSVPFAALHDVLAELSPWLNQNGGPDGPNVEYLICRRVRQGVLRGKGKISFPNRIRRLVTKDDDLAAGLSALSERIEEAWRAKLDPNHRVRELTVSWRENWLGHWTSPLD
jgi:hypothetical protein